tara:strand:+ start:153 stop:818 length:666 start_codon:yes stop_codon:yes gene_type:complete
MKKLLFILFFFPLISLSQGLVDCSLLEVTDVVIDNTNLTIDIAVYNGDTMDSHYPFIAYTIDALGDTIQSGNFNWFVTPALDTSWYSYTIPSSIVPSYPLSIYFAYTNLTGLNPGYYTCILTYNIIECVDETACNYNDPAQGEECVFPGDYCEGITIENMLFDGVLDFNCNCIEAESTVNEIMLNKQTIKVLDFLGREVTKKGFQLHIYDDGSIDKRYILE